MKFLVLAAALVASLAVNARPRLMGHVVGNGGGVICIAGECKTLSEAGLQLVPEYDGVWLPEGYHYSEVQKTITNKVTLPKDVAQYLNTVVFGNADMFRRVDVIDPAKLDAIKKRYVELSNEAGFPLDPATFEVVAFSSDDTVTPAMTYLLPGFFKLDIYHQASILFHEGLYRGRPSSHLKFVLQFESAIYCINPPPKSGCKGSALRHKNDQAILAYRFGFMPLDRMVGALLSQSYIEKYEAEHLGSYAATNEYVELPGTISVAGAGAKLKVDHAKLIQLATVEPRLPYMFSKIDEIELVKTWGQDVDSRIWNSIQYAPNVLHVDWMRQGATELLRCEWGTGGNASCLTFTIPNPATLNLLIPE